MLYLAIGGDSMVKGTIYIHDSKGMTRIKFNASHILILKRKMRNYCKNYLLFAEKHGMRISHIKQEFI